MGRKELEAELRELRATKGAKPISKMKMTDIATEIERLKVVREETPAVRAVSSSTPSKRSESSVENVKEAKAKEFPTRPTKQAKAEAKEIVASKRGGVSKKATPPSQSKKVSKAELMKMLGEMSDSDVE